TRGRRLATPRLKASARSLTDAIWQAGESCRREPGVFRARGATLPVPRMPDIQELRLGKAVFLNTGRPATARSNTTARQAIVGRRRSHCQRATARRTRSRADRTSTRARPDSIQEYFCQGTVEFLFYFWRQS